MEKRINYIDISRAFAILVIILGHSIVHSEHCKLIYKFLYSFNIVYFFVISGYVFSLKESFLSFMKKKFVKIMIPYFIWATLYLIPYILIGNQVEQNFSILNKIFKIIYGNGNMLALKQNTSLWFLPALFSMNLFFYPIIKIANKFKFNWLLLIPLFLLSYLSITFLNDIIILPWGLNTVLNIGIVFYLGYLFKKFKVFDRILKIYYVFPLFSLGVFCCFLNIIVSCVEYKYGNFVLALISGTCISIFFIYISYLINRNKILQYIGCNTMGLLIFHKIAILFSQSGGGS